MKEKIKRQSVIEIGGIDFRAKFTLKVEGGDRSLLEEEDELEVEKLICQDLDFLPVFEEADAKELVDSEVWRTIDEDEDEEWEEED